MKAEDTLGPALQQLTGKIPYELEPLHSRVGAIEAERLWLSACACAHTYVHTYTHIPTLRGRLRAHLGHPVQLFLGEQENDVKSSHVRNPSLSNEAISNFNFIFPLLVKKARERENT